MSSYFNIQIDNIFSQAKSGVSDFYSARASVLSNLVSKLCSAVRNINSSSYGHYSPRDMENPAKLCSTVKNIKPSNYGNYSPRKIEALSHLQHAEIQLQEHKNERLI
ncbi:hypothetical protein SGGMMB4_01743 [Sodalis glossinidius str. 'morsitans']|uniref:Uncharacterized protein n=1 Tax=Sodalis glossinidius (strain morsitans) TaxID=343509 RepID=A0A193QI25_SODGM|nr:hypothetical protein [Sodalis glossinidius]CRL44575.1 hypothetical protein SGGMMB4_01743 [Sodalis glossinidius str. 'morsitans']